MAQLQISSSSRSNRNSKPNVNGIEGGKSNTSSSSISPSKRGCCLGCQNPRRGSLVGGRKRWSLQSAGRSEGIEGIRREKQLTTGEKARKRSSYEYGKQCASRNAPVYLKETGIVQTHGTLLCEAQHSSPRPFKTGISGSSTNTKEISSDAAVSYFPLHHSSRRAASCPE